METEPFWTSRKTSETNGPSIVGSVRASLSHWFWSIKWRNKEETLHWKDLYWGSVHLSHELFVTKNRKQAGREKAVQMSDPVQNKEYLAYFLYWLKGRRDWMDASHIDDVFECSWEQTLRSFSSVRLFVFCGFIFLFRRRNDSKETTAILKSDRADVFRNISVFQCRVTECCWNHLTEQFYARSSPNKFWSDRLFPPWEDVFADIPRLITTFPRSTKATGFLCSWRFICGRQTADLLSSSPAGIM